MHLITWKRVCGISSILCGRVSLLLLPRDHLGLTSKHNALCCCSSAFSLHSHSGEASRPLRVSSCDRYFCFSRSACSCRGCVCPSCWLPYNIKECECRSCPILHTRMVPPTHTLCICVCITLSLSCTFLFAWHSHSHTAFVLLVLLFFYGFCLVGCFADRLQLDVMARREAGSWVCRLVFRGLLYGESPHSSPTHLPRTPRRDSTHHKGHFPVRAIHLLNVSY